jgi:biopolymer transport protein TolR
MKRKKRSLEFHINLLPFIDILTVCIAFLLVAAVMTQVGTFDLSQAVGTSGASASKSQPSMWIHFENNGTVQISLKEASKLDDNLQLRVIQSKGSGANIDEIENFAKNIKAKVPNLNIALLMPAPESSYNDLIQVMDKLKKLEISDIGIAPL